MAHYNVGKNNPMYGRERLDIAKRNRENILTGHFKGKNNPNYGKVGYWTNRKHPAKTGKNHHNWKGGITPLNERIRKSEEYKLWREAVLIRDNWTCQSCGKRGGKLHAHHSLSFAKFPHKRFDITNGITLCINCHRKTNNYGVNN